MAPKATHPLHLRPRLISFDITYSLDLKTFLASRKKYVKLTADYSYLNGMKIATIGLDSVPVYLMDVALENVLTHRKAAYFDSLVQTVDTLKSIHTLTEFVHFVSLQLPVDTSSALQVYQSVSMSTREFVFSCIPWQRNGCGDHYDEEWSKEKDPWNQYSLGRIPCIGHSFGR